MTEMEENRELNTLPSIGSGKSVEMLTALKKMMDKEEKRRSSKRRRGRKKMRKRRKASLLFKNMDMDNSVIVGWGRGRYKGDKW